MPKVAVGDKVLRDIDQRSNRGVLIGTLMRFRRRKPRPLACRLRRFLTKRRAIARRRRGIYLLPNLFTLANLFAGFFAIVQAMNQQFEMAAIAIFAALVLDGMDGRVARLTNTQSAFGEQFDSLSDMTSFGVAPGIGDVRVGVAGSRPLGVGRRIRLLRAAQRCGWRAFNANLGVVDKRFFQGLPSPAAAALIAGFVWLAVDNKFPIREAWLPWVAFLLTVYAGLHDGLERAVLQRQEFSARAAAFRSG